MGRSANYRRDHSKMKAWADLERRVRNNENIMVKKGQGKYPDCLQDKKFEFCPDKIPNDNLDVPSECKQCPHFLNSKFYSKKYMTHERRIAMLKKRGLPLIIGGK